MKKVILISLMVLFILCPTLPVFAGGDKPSVAKAKTFWEYNRNNEAINCLRKVLAVDIENNEAYFLLGKYNLALDNYDEADKAFAPAPVQRKYGNRIAQIYLNEANKKLAQNDRKNAEIYFRKAFSANQTIRPIVLNDLFDKGRKQPDRYFTLVINLDSSYRPKIANFYKSKSDSATSEEGQMSNLKKAADADNARFGGKYHINAQALGRKYLDLAKENARWVGKEALTEKYRALAKRYLGNSIVSKELPKVKDYVIKDYWFRFSKGEKTTHFIRNPQGIRTKNKFYCNNRMFGIRYRNGKMYNISIGEKLPKEDNEPFEIIALDDTTVCLEISKK